MAARNSYVDLNLRKNSLLQAKIYPVDTTTKNGLVTTLSLGTNDEGLAVFDTDLNKLQIWDGTAFIDAVPSLSAGVNFRGAIAHSASAPSAVTGDLYIFNTAGTNNWNTSGVEVQVGDLAVYNGTSWDFIQGNAIQATETVLGLVEIATQPETDAGTSDLAVITPLKLVNYAPPSTSNPRPARIYKTTIASLAANTPATVTHNLAVNDAAEVVVQTYQGGAQIDLVVSPTSVNALTIESNVALSNVTVVVVG